MRIRAVWLAVVFASGSVTAVPPADVPPDATFESDGSTLVWSAVATADAYDVYRGSDPAAGDHTCRIFRTPSTSAVLPDAPTMPGELHYFLVGAVNADGPGDLGDGSDGLPRPNDSPCTDTDGDAAPDNLDNCPALPNPAQHDQDENGVGDRCDPRTYDFEADPAGSRPAEMIRLGGGSQTLSVKERGGERVVSYDLPGVGAHDRFERLVAEGPFEDTTVYVDVEESGGVASIELWSEGAYGWNAGGGLILQVDSAGGLVMYRRRGQEVPAQPGPSLPAGGRLRLRIVKGPGTTSALHVDERGPSGWSEDLAVFPVEDDHLLRGRGVVLADYLDAVRGVKRVTVVPAPPQQDLVISRHPGLACDWKVFQRNAADVATVPVRVRYRLSGPGRLQARVVPSGSGSALPGHDWIDHEIPLETAADGVAALDLTGVPAGGNYDVEVRLVREADGAVLAEESVVEIAVGDVFVAGGQSNMSGYSGTLDGAETPTDGVHLFHNDGTWKRATEPMDSGVDQVDRVSEESPAHSLMLRFAKEIHGATGVPVGIIPGPLGGTNLYAQWQRNEADRDDRGTLYGSLLHRVRVQEYEAPPRGFLWYQGESDVGRGTALYRIDLERLIAQYREDLDAPDLFFQIAQLATYLLADLPSWLAIQEAQRQTAEADDHVVLTATVDLPRADVIHLDVNGYKTLGARMALAAREHLYGESVDASARLVAARSAANGGRVDLEYDAEVRGGEIGLYQVRDSSGLREITGLSVSGSVVSLDVRGRLKAGATVTYGLSNSPVAAWVKDLAGTAVACFDAFPVEP